MAGSSLPGLIRHYYNYYTLIHTHPAAWSFSWLWAGEIDLLSCTDRCDVHGQLLLSKHNGRIDFANRGFPVYARYDAHMKIVHYPFSCIDRVTIRSCRVLCSVRSTEWEKSTEKPHWHVRTVLCMYTVWSTSTKSTRDHGWYGCILLSASHSVYSIGSYA